MFNIDSAVRAAAERNKERQEELTKELSINASLLDPNSKEAKLDRARRLEADILCQIEELKWVRGQLKDARMAQLLDRLSELLAEQGKYEQAYKTAVDKERKSYYKSLVKASEIDDSTVCDCPPDKIRDTRTGREFTTPNEIILAEVYDAKSDSMKSLTKCVKCGFLNIK